MNIEFDPAKDVANRMKHGVSLELAAEMDLDSAVIVEDQRRDYREVRLIAYGRIGQRLYVLWYTLRGNAVRVIGLRKGNERERSRYDRTS